MSDYHILTGRGDGNSYQIVVHFPVPNVNNDAGVNYRTAIIQWLGGEQPSRCPFIAQAEQDQLDAGAVLERVYTFNTRPMRRWRRRRCGWRGFTNRSWSGYLLSWGRFWRIGA